MNRRILAVIALAVLGLTSMPAAAAARSGRAERDAPLGRAERVLVFSVPTLSWADVDELRPRHLRDLLARSAVADLSPRAVSRATDSTDGYATLDAGTRSLGTAAAKLAFVASANRSGGSDADGDPVEPPHQVFEAEPPSDDPALGVFSDPDEPAAPAQPEPADPVDPSAYRASPSAQEFARRTGVEPDQGQVFNFGLVSMLQTNESLFYGSEVGALGTALRKAGVRRAVIANGDHPEGADTVAYRREATVGLMDARGVVDAGRVGKTLLVKDPAAPFGTRYDIDEVVASFEEFWQDESVVLVEASDLVRFEEFRSVASESQGEELQRRAVQQTDELLGRLLEQVDPRRDAVVVVAPYASNAGTSLTVFGVRGPGVEPGLLSSGTTRRAGFVQTVDVAPTILSLVGVDAPSSMEGTRMERASAGGSFGDRVAHLIGANDGARFRDSMIGPISTVFVICQIVLWGAAAFVITRNGGRRRREFLEVVTLAVLLFLPTTFLAGAFPFARWGAAAYWAFVVAVPTLAAIAVHALTRNRLVDPLLVALSVVVGLLAVDLVIGAPLQFNTVFGYTPTVAGRFAGLGNPAFSMLAAGGILLAVLLAYRVGGRRGSLLGVGVLVGCLLLDGLPFLGADVGGALTLVPTVGIVACMLLGIRVRLRTLLLWVGGAVVVTTGFGFLDLTRAPEDRTHLGRLLADIGANGLDALNTVIVRKLEANLSVILSSVWTLMVPVAFAFVGYVFWRAPGRLRRISQAIPQERAAVVGLLVAMVLGFALNDSGITVPGLMLGVANAALVHLLLRVSELPVVVQPAGGRQSARSQSDEAGPQLSVST